MSRLSPTARIALPHAAQVVQEATKETDVAIRKLIANRGMLTRIKNKILDAQAKLTKNDRDQAIYSRLNEALWLIMKM